VATKPLRVDGVDISHHQSGKLDLVGAKRRGLKWVYHKATEGDTFVDSNYGKRRAEAKAAGLPFGAYHFARPEKADAVAEARRFIAIAKPQPGDLRPALDLETTEGMSMAAIRTWAGQFIAEVERLTGVKPIVYTPYDLGTVARGCLMWRPRYNSDNRPPVLPYDIFQFSNGVLGVPNTIAGVGHVDLNYMRPGLTVAQMQIPKAKPAPKPTERVHVMTAPLQFSISDKATTADLEKIFARAQKRGVKVICGTEAGSGAGNTSAELVRIGAKYGFLMWVPSAVKGASAAQGGTTDCWIAVAKDFTLDGKFASKGFDPVIPGSRALYVKNGATKAEADKMHPRWGTKGLVRCSVKTKLGLIHIGAGHYLTEARHPKAIVKGVDHWEWNKKLADHISAWAVESGKGSNIVLYGGDQNMSDARNDEPQGDTFFGGPLTSLADELKHWENTGHGPIDVFATYDGDGRVSAAYWRSLDDKEFPLTQDHFLSEGGVDIRTL
jgi:GH25 family lysozyme M1 (1,4-beta-N-acetylmuramidase)